jgi:hypothetical protein
MYWRGRVIELNDEPSVGERLYRLIYRTPSPSAAPSSWIVGLISDWIGGTSPGLRNVISGNGAGIYFQSGSNHVVQGNLIGTDRNGTAAVANGTGIRVQQSNDALIGGTTAQARNIITNRGIVVTTAARTRIQGNFIGTDRAGAADLGLVAEPSVFAGRIADLHAGIASERQTRLDGVLVPVLLPETGDAPRRLRDGRQLCGAPTRNGSPCRRWAQPNGRCLTHG